MKFIYNSLIFCLLAGFVASCVINADPAAPVNPALPSNTTFVPASFQSIRVSNAQVIIRKGTTTGYYVTRSSIDALNTYNQYIKVSGGVFDYTPSGSAVALQPTLTLVMASINSMQLYNFAKAEVQDSFEVGNLQITTANNADIRFKQNMIANAFSFVGSDFGDLSMTNLEVRTLANIETNNNADFVLSGNLTSENINCKGEEFGDISMNNLTATRELNLDMANNADLMVRGDIKANSLVFRTSWFSDISCTNLTVQQTLNINSQNNAKTNIRGTLTLSNGLVANLQDFATLNVSNLATPQNATLNCANNSAVVIDNALAASNLTFNARDFASFRANNLTIGNKTTAELRNNSDFIVSNTLKTNELNSRLTEFGSLSVSNLDNTLTKITTDQNAKVSLRGRTTTLDFEQNAQNEYNFYGLVTDNVVIKHNKTTGLSSHIRVIANRSINVTILGRWNVYYKGTATNITTSYASTGRLIKEN